MPLGHVQSVAYTEQVPVDERRKATSQADIRAAMERLCSVHRSDAARAEWPDKWSPQAWKLYSTDGAPVSTLGHLTQGGIFLLMEGGAFVWPGIEKGFVRRLTFHDRELNMETLELQPLILSIDGFISDGEVDTIIKESEPRVAPSGVTMNDRDRAAGKKNSDFRTSETYWLHSRDAWIKNIDVRVANVTRTPVNFQETVQVGVMWQTTAQLGCMRCAHICNHWQPGHPAMMAVMAVMVSLID